MTKSELLENLSSVEKMATGSKIKRMLSNPSKYINGILFRELNYKRNKKEKEVVSNSFFGDAMHLLLPSSMDIYLTGGKSHESEIRLAKFLIDNLEKGDAFIDVGAHYGYFTLLGSKLVGQEGKVCSFEASPTTYNVLHKNTSQKCNIESYNRAVSDEHSELTFYEFPNMYSEYNTLDVSQFKNEDWFSEYKPKEIKIESVILDKFLSEKKVQPKIIKIDVEGAEYKVIHGLSKYLSAHSTAIAMEYLSDERGSQEHHKAEKLLKSLGFTSHTIDTSGKLVPLEAISNYLKDKNLESDNIVFTKP